MLAPKILKDVAVLTSIALGLSSISWIRWNAKAQLVAPNEVIASDFRLRSSNIVWVDARSQIDYDKEHVTGAVLLNEDRWDALLGRVFEIWKPEKPIVVYCSPGCQASEKVAQRLRDLGLEPVYFLKGGYDAWKQAHHQNIL